MEGRVRVRRPLLPLGRRRRARRAVLVGLRGALAAAARRGDRHHDPAPAPVPRTDHVARLVADPRVLRRLPALGHVVRVPGADAAGVLHPDRHRTGRRLAPADREQGPADRRRDVDGARAPDAVAPVRSGRGAVRAEPSAAAVLDRLRLERARRLLLEPGAAVPGRPDPGDRREREPHLLPGADRPHPDRLHARRAARAAPPGGAGGAARPAHDRPHPLGDGAGRRLPRRGSGARRARLPPLPRPRAPRARRSRRARRRDHRVRLVPGVRAAARRPRQGRRPDGPARDLAHRRSAGRRAAGARVGLDQLLGPVGRPLQPARRPRRRAVPAGAQRLPRHRVPARTAGPAGIRGRGRLARLPIAAPRHRASPVRAPPPAPHRRPPRTGAGREPAAHRGQLGPARDALRRGAVGARARSARRRSERRGGRSRRSPPDRPPEAAAPRAIRGWSRTRNTVRTDGGSRP